MACSSCNKNLKLFSITHSLQPIYCNNSMTKIYNYLANKTVDISGLPRTTYPVLPPLSTWGVVNLVGETGQLVTEELFYQDVSSDNFYTYTLSISIVNTEVPTDCNSNPITDCMCIHADTIDIEGNISYDVPQEFIDTSLSTLPITSILPPVLSSTTSNIGMYLILGSVGIVTLYFAHKKKII